MAEEVGKLFGAGGGNNKAAKAAERRQLAALAHEQAELDQAKSGRGGRTGRRLLTFLGSSSGSGTIG